jgi:hypothetical protein
MRGMSQHCGVKMFQTFTFGIFLGLDRGVYWGDGESVCIKHGNDYSRFRRATDRLIE